MGQEAIACASGMTSTCTGRSEVAEVFEFPPCLHSGGLPNKKRSCLQYIPVRLPISRLVVVTIP